MKDAQVESSQLASYLRFSRWSYAALSAIHILGIAALVGSIIPLNLKLIGAWKDSPLSIVARILVPVAAAGLLMAVLSGALLFSVRPQDYAALEVFQIKMSLVALGIASAIWFHWRRGLTMERAPRRARVMQAGVSMTCWLGALFCGRLIAFFF